MEGLAKRLWIVSAVVLAAGAYAQFGPKPEGRRVDETWMEKNSLSSLGDFQMIKVTDESPMCSYKMDESTYTTLEASGIVARVFQKGSEAYDVVLISSDNSKSFHDPRVCFNAQGWQLKSQKESTLQTQTRGTIPVTVVKTQNTTTGKEQTALFFYRSPDGFVAAPKAMRMQMFWDKVTTLKNEPGVFYRFMPVTDVTDEQLFKFAADYLDESGKLSNNFF